MRFLVYCENDYQVLLVMLTLEFAFRTATLLFQIKAHSYIILCFLFLFYIGVRPYLFFVHWPYINDKLYTFCRESTDDYSARENKRDQDRDRKRQTCSLKSLHFWFFLFPMIFLSKLSLFPKTYTRISYLEFKLCLPVFHIFKLFLPFKLDYFIFSFFRIQLKLNKSYEN